MPGFCLLVDVDSNIGRDPQEIQMSVAPATSKKVSLFRPETDPDSSAK